MTVEQPAAADEGGADEGGVAGPWIHCPWCADPVPLTHFVESDEEQGAWEAVCGGCGRRVTFVPPEEPDDRAQSTAA